MDIMGTPAEGPWLIPMGATLKVLGQQPWTNDVLNTGVTSCLQEGEKEASPRSVVKWRALGQGRGYEQK